MLSSISFFLLGRLPHAGARNPAQAAVKSELAAASLIAVLRILLHGASQCLNSFSKPQPYKLKIGGQILFLIQERINPLPGSSYKGLFSQ